jgi:polysaccharide export outer membrane protein
MNLRSCAAATLLAVAVLLAPWSAAPLHAEEVAAQPPAEALDPGYRIGPEDVLEISVWKEEGLRKEALVRPDGAITFPLVGEIQAGGKTALEIQGEIKRGLDKLIADAVVTVTVLRVASNKFYVIGRVNKPGEFVAGRYIDVLQALSMAGGLTPFASENGIKVLRREGDRKVVLPFRFSDMRKGVNFEQNIILRGGDVVLVP